MNLTKLRRVARQLGMAPWELVQQADALAAELEALGIAVNDEKPEDGALSGGALLALLGSKGKAADR